MSNHFLHTIQQLRQHETVVLYENWLVISEADQRETTAFLAQAYQEEAAGYPHTAPPFDPVAGLWAAKTVYLACQLVMHRAGKPADLNALLPDFAGPVTASVLLSADLTLRFLPDIVNRLSLIDPDDVLIAVLTKRLETGHYSAIRTLPDGAALAMEPVLADACLYQLYIDRVIRYKNKPLALHPALTDGIRASLGLYADHFWRELAHEL